MVVRDVQGGSGGTTNPCMRDTSNIQVVAVAGGTKYIW